MVTTVTTVDKLKAGDVFKMSDNELPFEDMRGSGVTRKVRYIEHLTRNSTTVTTTLCGYAYTFLNGTVVELIQ